MIYAAEKVDALQEGALLRATLVAANSELLPHFERIAALEQKHTKKK